MKKLDKLFSFWLIFAVLPVLVLSTVLILFYSPLQGVGYKYFYARGTILQESSGKYSLKLKETSLFWDKSDAIPEEKNLELSKINNPEIYKPDETVIVKITGGRLNGFNGTLYKDYFQPLGVDWIESIIILFIGLSVFSLILTKIMV